MRSLVLQILIFLLFSMLSVNGAEDVTLFAPVSDATIAQLHQLDHWGLLADHQNKMLSSPHVDTLKSYDVAFMLVEPLERITALIAVQENPQATPAQRRRAEVAYFAVSRLSPIEFDGLIMTLMKLQLNYYPELNKLSPDLSRRSAPALQKLMQAEYRPWMQRGVTDAPADTPQIHVTIGPHSPDDPLKSHLDFLAPLKGSRSSFFSHAQSATVGSSSEVIVGTRPTSTLEAAVDIAFSGLRLYGRFGTLPGQDPATMVFRADGTGQAMLGVEFGLTKINNLGISGIFEFHVMRYGDPNNLDTDTGAVGGIGLHW